MRIATALWIVATWYGEPYVGRSLYCGGWYKESTPAWVAVDVREYEAGRVRCGDLLDITWKSGERLSARAWDAGPFEGYYVEDWGRDLPIVVDVPEHLWPVHPARSALVRVRNVTAELRGEMEWRAGR